MCDPAFVGAGQKEGLELWRIEALKPVKLETVNGKFYKGDSYILMSTKAKRNGSGFEWNIHFWLGSETSTDESGCAAYKTVELDESLGGGPVQYREVEGNESQLFLSYFKSSGGIEYLPGGMVSGFRKVERDVWPTRLLHLKGKRTVRVREVSLSTSSLNQGDVFILDAGLKLYLFNGSQANKYEKAKGVEVISNIDSDSRGGRAQIIRLEDDPRNSDFWDTLGGYVDPESLPIGDDDDAVEAEGPSRLFQLSSGASGIEVVEIPLEGKKPTKSQLSSDFVFMLQTDSKIFLWVGSKAPLAVKREAMPTAVRHITEARLPSTTAVERVAEGTESSTFKVEFGVWNLPSAFGPKAVAKAKPEDVPIDIAELQARKALEERPIDDGSGRVQIWLISDFKKNDVEPSKYGQFYGGDSYIVQYTYMQGSRECHIIYFWLGSKSSIDEKGSAALLTKELSDQLGGNIPQVRVTQGKEPAHFRQIFKGRMIVHEGGKASGFKNSTEEDTIDTDGVALFHVKGSTPLNTSATQVPEVCTSLNSDDCFVLVTPGTVFCWEGSGCTADESAVATNVATILAGDFLGTGGRAVVSVKEGSEPEEFWNTLGGKGEYAQHAPGELPPADPRLFWCSTATGTFKVEEILDFTQEDLLDDDVFLLDTFTQVFVWVGNGSTEEEKAKSGDLAQRYIAQATDGRDPDCPVIKVDSGSEPLMFTAQFVVWDPAFFERNKFVDPYEARLAKLREEKERKRKEEEQLESNASETDSSPRSNTAIGTTSGKGVYANVSLRAASATREPSPKSNTPSGSTPLFANFKLRSTGSSIIAGESSGTTSPTSSTATSAAASEDSTTVKPSPYARPLNPVSSSAAAASAPATVAKPSPYARPLNPVASSATASTAAAPAAAAATKPTPYVRQLTPVTIPAPAPAPAPAPVAVTYDTPVPGSFTYDQLKGAPDGVDPARKEEYLGDEAFVAIIGVDRVSFAKLPKWKRDAKKKQIGLF